MPQKIKKVKMTLDIEESKEVQLNKILNKPEWEPSNDLLWKKIQDYYQYGEIPNYVLEYKNIKDDVEKYIKLISELNGEIPSYETPQGDKIYKLFKYFNNDKYVMTYTTTTMRSSYLKQIYNLNIDNTRALKDLRDVDPETLKCKLMGVFKGEISTKEMNRLKEEYGKETIYDNAKGIMDKLISEKFEETSYYIYRLYNNTTQYIYGSFKKIMKKDKKIIEQLINNMNLQLNNYKNELLEEIKIKLECQGLLKVDDYIKRYDSIINGQNICYNIVSDDIFKITQKNIMNKLYNDTNDYTNGLICSIQYDDKQYIFKCNKNKSIKDTLNCLYVMDKEISEKKIIEILEKIPYEQLIIKIIEKNIKDNELDEKYYYYTKVFKTYINGYNTIIDYSDMVKKQVSNIAFASMAQNKKNNYRNTVHYKNKN